MSGIALQSQAGPGAAVASDIYFQTSLSLKFLIREWEAITVSPTFLLQEFLQQRNELT